MKTLNLTVSSFFFLSLLFMTGCAQNILIKPEIQSHIQNTVTEADRLFTMGSYVALKEAFCKYKNLLGYPYLQKETKEKLLRTSLLLALRSKELGIADECYLQIASDMIREFPSLAPYETAYRSIYVTPLKKKSIIGGYLDQNSQSTLEKFYDWINENIDTVVEALRQHCESDEFYAYCYISFRLNFPYWLKDMDDLERFKGLFPDSKNISFRLSVRPPLDLEGLNALISQDPSYFEAHLHLGQWHLARGDLIQAEENLKEFLRHIPGSTVGLLSLARIHFAFEELEKSLDAFNQVLDIIPQYRDALLGKAVCLSNLGRHGKALETCRQMISLGLYFLGEAHYWTAWNFYELEQPQEAWHSIMKAQYYLEGFHDVLLLKGIIAYALGMLDEAETALQAALEIDKRSCEAAFYLGKVNADRKEWGKSGLYFEKAACCHQAGEQDLQDKIQEIKDSGLHAERKSRLLKKKERNLLTLQLNKATAFYNAAAGYFNSGDIIKAENNAKNSASHPSFKILSQELIEKIAQR